jgi:hypothetical protein
MLQLKPKGYLLAEFPLAESLIVLRYTHIREGNLLYSKSTTLNANLIQKSFTETPRTMFDQIAGHIKLAITDLDLSVTF